MEYKIIHQFRQNGGNSNLLSALEASTREVLRIADLGEDRVFFRAIVGHASVGGIELVREHIIVPLLSAKNLSVQWVVGIDFNSRPKDTINALNALIGEFGARLGKRLDIRIFSSNGQKKSSIMHTKMYWVGVCSEGRGERCAFEQHRAFIGSSNLSVGGLVENREIGVRIELSEKDKRGIRELETVWKDYARSDKCHSLNEKGFYARFERRGGGKHTDWKGNHPKHKKHAKQFARN